MARYRIDFDRPNCAAHSNCSAVCPAFWSMQQDGKSSVAGGTRREDGWETLEIDEKDLACNKDAAFACPVNVIHITNLETGEKII